MPTKPSRDTHATTVSSSPVSTTQEQVEISNSGLECLMSCPRKYYWRYERKIQSLGENQAPPLVWGSAIHKGLEVRGSGGDLSTACEAFRSVFTMESAPKYTIQGGMLALKDYYERYQTEPYEVIENEYKFRVKVNGFVFIGIFDKVLWNRETKRIVVMDHKSTGRLGQDFYESANPNSQFTGYIYCADCEFGEVDTLIIDGIMVPYAYKTKPMVGECERFSTQRTEWELEEWKRNTEHHLKSLHQYREQGYFPKSDKGFTCKWCGFRELCLIPQPYNEVEIPEEEFQARERRK